MGTSKHRFSSASQALRLGFIAVAIVAAGPLSCVTTDFAIKRWANTRPEADTNISAPVTPQAKPPSISVAKSSSADAGQPASTVAVGSNWQYAKWGMSPQELLQASNGVASETKRESDENKRSALLSAPYQSGPLEFTAFFIFNKQRQLNGIELELKNDDKCPGLVLALTSTYGPPKDTIKSDVTTTFKWWDETRGNVVAYFRIAGYSCRVEYWPLNQPGAPGGL
ncbi:MAG: hypothetical protein E5V92_02820 [Mesorhizobium sp.]|uniref:hypothetical protein n=1 Tax=unclassified Mesorhizobium TaxID=325217 RepID=UPI000F7634A0|nr:MULTISPECIES: hypothetical protein [unclassified Mesorhizobium]AZO72156.1 hypothetical protein EJ067_14125 [Mesorhizobium sp. M1D.F.Ca.ET.043.01.1.1]RWA94939.1 MAG: hypothetical protein EOQ32_10665 [Mesorhizobium sp.]RWE17650.1 MAG: hypothetical protein EOS61_02195 [Mesorhizobium sp.]TJW89857.1 MAG: hypothetical protein E5V92_02820 [Mesorhizobium sp.]